VLAELEAAGLIDKVEKIRHSVPYSQRSETPVEPMLSEQWYADARKLAEDAIRAVEDGRTRFVPEQWAATYFEWMRNIQPWCISRQLWWGHQIPAWYGPDGAVFVAESEADAAVRAEKHYKKAVKLTRDEDVLDTWFSSGLWAFSTLGWPDKTPELARYYPTAVLVTGFDIIFFWIARMMMMGLHFMQEVPFHTVYIHALVRDEKGQKISKSKGNGLTIDEWLRYASPESLSLFMYREPKAAKRLYFDVIPRTVDEYQQLLDGYQRQDAKQRLSNPVWHIHSGRPPRVEMPVSFSMLLTLVSSSNAENAETLWGFIGRYRPGVTPQTHPELNAQVQYAIHYFRDFVLPEKKFRHPSDAERAALIDLRDALAQLPADGTAETIQNVVYEVGRREPFLDAKKKAKDGKPGVSLDWFNMLYQVLLGQEKGPRFGSFVAVYGLQNTIDMIDGALARSA